MVTARVWRSRPGETALKVGRIYPGTTFSTQAQGTDVIVAELKQRFPAAEKTITMSDFHELDTDTRPSEVPLLGAVTFGADGR
ncbi:hypothetical protein ACFV2H_51275 [Streptomyces sp. NPDC059629]|uniref:hypothetical protein n=1 Tax=Streptomyces sp. NPDC059629 TaxID=3346889 RepID=UPI0036749E0E